MKVISSCFNITRAEAKACTYYLLRSGPKPRQIIELEERLRLNRGAALSSCSQGRLMPEPLDPFRTCFARDRDRIIYSTHYKKLPGKTQVFSQGLLSLFQDAHLHHRDLHVQKVAQIARDICRALGLNEDLAEAIALGHDLGHPPFGHEGEKILNELSRQHLNKPFRHNLQSLRIVTELEPRNLSIEVLDGIVCHNGETKDTDLIPHPRPMGNFEFDDQLMPMTLEGCVVRLADRIAYLPMDLTDGLHIGLIEPARIPEVITRRLGRNASEIINTLVTDVILQSANNRDKKGRVTHISMSRYVREAMNALQDFNYKHIYFSEINRDFKATIRECLTTIFSKLMKPPGATPQEAIDNMVMLTDREALEIFKQIKT
jgi:dGTPase